MPEGGSERRRRPHQIVAEWWGVALIAAGIVGGYLWMERTFARIDQLEFLLQEKFARIERLERERCQLHYTIKRESTEIELKALEEDIADVRWRLDKLRRPANRDEDAIHFAEGSLEALLRKEDALGQRRSCIIDAFLDCQTGSTDITQCRD